MRRAINEFQAPYPVQRVKATAGPIHRRSNDGLDVLLKPAVLKRCYPRAPNARPVALAGVLDRSPQNAFLLEHSARRPRCGLIDENWIGTMCFPGAAQGTPLENRERIGPRSCSVTGRREHPEPSASNKERRVARFDAVQEHAFAHPSRGEWIGPVQCDGAIGRAFRNHPDLLAPFEYEGIGWVPRLVQAGLRRPGGPVFLKGDNRHD